MTRISLIALALWMVSGLLPAQQAEIDPQSGKASIVIFRAAQEPLLSAHNVAYPIVFDEQWISNLPKGEYFVFPAWEASATRRYLPVGAEQRFGGFLGDHVYGARDEKSGNARKH